MKDEIKLAIDIFKQIDLDTDVGGCHNCPKKGEDKTCIGCLNNAKDKLLNCITNLQEDLKSIKENYKIQLEYDKDLEKRFDSLLEAHKICDEEEQEKQERIGKAIEYIQNRIEDINNGGNEHDYRNLNEILNILQGSDTNE